MSSEFERYTATLHTIARIYDVGNQLLAQSGKSRWSGLPRTFEEYVARLYGARPTDRFMLLNYGLLGAIVALAVVLMGLIR